MPSLHKQPNRPFWFCAFTDGNGKRLFRSTKTADKRQAQVVCNQWHRAARLAQAKHLTPESAREIIAEGIADIYTSSTQHGFPTATARQWCNQWLDGKAIEAEPSTTERYRVVIRSFLDHLGKAADRDLATIRADEIERFLHKEAEARSRATANYSLKVLRGCFGAALKRSLVTTNQAAVVDILKTRHEKKRRPLTLAEIRKVLNVADDEWKGLVLCGLYIGQCLGDLARLTWQNVDLAAGTLSIVTQKTGRRIELPLAKDLQEYLEKLPTSDDPTQPLFPKACRLYTTNRSTLSRQFMELLAQAGLVAKKKHVSEGKGRSTGRDISPISFHSLRHSAVTFLKAAGVTEAVAMDLVGHETEAISRHYTALSIDDKRKAVDVLPSIKAG